MVVKQFKPVGKMDIPQFISWEDESGDLTAWLGNDMQKDAIHALYALASRVARSGSDELRHDFDRLQTADHFRHMSTKWFSSEAPDRPSPFGSPYDAYITFMNVLADFEMRLKAIEEQQKVPDPAKTAPAKTAPAKPGLAKSPKTQPKTAKKAPDKTQAPGKKPVTGAKAVPAKKAKPAKKAEPNPKTAAGKKKAAARGTAAGPSSWDGYVAAITSDACVAAQATEGQAVAITLPARPALYR